MALRGKEPGKYPEDWQEKGHDKFHEDEEGYIWTYSGLGISKIEEKYKKKYYTKNYKPGKVTEKNVKQYLEESNQVLTKIDNNYKLMDKNYFVKNYDRNTHVTYMEQYETNNKNAEFSSVELIGTPERLRKKSSVSTGLDFDKLYMLKEVLPYYSFDYDSGNDVDYYKKLHSSYADIDWVNQSSDNPWTFTFTDILEDKLTDDSAISVQDENEHISDIAFINEMTDDEWKAYLEKSGIVYAENSRPSGKYNEALDDEAISMGDVYKILNPNADKTEIDTLVTNSLETDMNVFSDNEITKEQYDKIDKLVADSTTFIKNLTPNENHHYLKLSDNEKRDARQKGVKVFKDDIKNIPPERYYDFGSPFPTFWWGQENLEELSKGNILGGLFPTFGEVGIPNPQIFSDKYIKPHIKGYVPEDWEDFISMASAGIGAYGIYKGAKHVPLTYPWIGKEGAFKVGKWKTPVGPQLKTTTLQAPLKHFLKFKAGYPYIAVGKKIGLGGVGQGMQNLYNKIAGTSIVNNPNTMKIINSPPQPSKFSKTPMAVQRFEMMKKHGMFVSEADMPSSYKQIRSTKPLSKSIASSFKAISNPFQNRAFNYVIPSDKLGKQFGGSSKQFIDPYSKVKGKSNYFTDPYSGKQVLIHEKWGTSDVMRYNNYFKAKYGMNFGKASNIPSKVPSVLDNYGKTSVGKTLQKTYDQSGPRNITGNNPYYSSENKSNNIVAKSHKAKFNQAVYNRNSNKINSINRNLFGNSTPGGGRGSIWYTGLSGGGYGGGAGGWLPSHSGSGGGGMPSKFKSRMPY